MRWLTAGESHGEALVAVLEGFPAGVQLTSKDFADALARRRLGYGRGGRMSFEADAVRILGGLRHGITQGGPLAVEIGNSEWPKWTDVMAADPVDPALLDRPRNAPLVRPRPGHADLTGMRKYGFDDARPVLERASARETAARVALGAAASALLNQAADIRLVAHVVAVGSVALPDDAKRPSPDDAAYLDADPIRCFDPAVSAQLVAEIDAAKEAGDTLGGIVEVLAVGVPPGLGTYVSPDRRLDARLAAAVMSIPAIKGVEIGDGFESARRRGSVAHDEMDRVDGRIKRRTNHAGGIEGGMSNGEPILVRAAMKPISTVPRALATVDVTTGENATAIHQRSDVCAVAAAAVVAEAMVALILADALLEKTGGDTLTEVRANLATYLDSIPEMLR